MIVVDGTQHSVTEDFAKTFNTVVRRKSRLIQVFGEHEVTMPLNCANKRSGTVFDWSGARLYVNFADAWLRDERGDKQRYAVLDMTRSTGVTHRGLYLAGTAADRCPMFGILQSRDLATLQAAGKNRFYDCVISGYMDVLFYNVGAEVSEVYGLRLDQKKIDAPAALYMAKSNVLEARSPFGDEPGNTSTATGAIYFGLHVRCDDKHNTTPGVVIDGFDNIRMDGVYIRTVGDAPAVIVDATRNAVDGIHISGLSTHGSPSVGIKIIGSRGKEIVNVRVIAQELSGAIPIAIGPADLMCAYFKHSSLAGVSVDAAAQLRHVYEDGREGVRKLDQTPETAPL